MRFIHPSKVLCFFFLFHFCLSLLYIIQKNTSVSCRLANSIREIWTQLRQTLVDHSRQLVIEFFLSWWFKLLVLVASGGRNAVAYVKRLWHFSMYSAIVVSHAPNSLFLNDSRTRTHIGNVTPSTPASMLVTSERALLWVLGSNKYIIRAPWKRWGYDLLFFCKKSAFNWLTSELENMSLVWRLTTSATAPSNLVDSTWRINCTRHAWRSGLFASNRCARFIDCSINKVRSANHNLALRCI